MTPEPMAHRSLREALVDLEAHGHLRRIDAELDPKLEMAAVQRRVYAAGGPAVWFTRVKGSPFSAVSNLFGTVERSRFLFRHTLARVEEMVALKKDPTEVLRRPFSHMRAPFTGLRALPKKVGDGPITYGTTQLDQLPQIHSWPDDGGAFITLPQVYTEHPERPGPMQSNLGMYRVQLSGNDYVPNREVGLHYQIHRGIGVHHSAALAKGEPLRVSIFVGGPPAHTFAAVMPLPEGLSELVFAGMLSGRRFRWTEREGHTLAADADFCIVGRVHPGRTKPEGPFGDHLGYYSLRHDFPVLEVERVYHRRDAIWPFTVVGRPPQEDTSFGAMIHEITGPLVPSEIPGLHAMHAVDVAGVHPLLLAIGSERYVPYQDLDESDASRGRRGPQELLTIANAILGFNQASLAKYLMIVDRNDAPTLDIHDLEAYFRHLLERVDWRRDLHFQTKTTIDTLDYSGEGLNAGSKVVMAAVGSPRRTLATSLDLSDLRGPFRNARLALPGVVVVEGAPWTSASEQAETLEALAAAIAPHDDASRPLWVLVDDAEFAARNVANFAWVTFTRSNPSHDIHGVDAAVVHKHWGCRGALIIDARIKGHHAPPLVEDPDVERRVDALAAPGGPLHGIY